MTRTRSLASLVAVALIAAVGPHARGARVSAHTPTDAATVAAIQAIVQRPITAGQVAGASIVVARRGATVIAESFGQADLELDVPMPPDASFEIGSVTKQFTAAAVLLLSERGKLGIDDEVTKFLPDFPTHSQHITVRHLLTHTSGIRGYTEMPEFLDLMPLSKPRQTLVKMFADKPLDFAPGEALVYNNSAYFLLGLIIEKVSGQSYAEFVKTNLFDRAGMPSSYYCSESAPHHHHAHGYDTDNGALVLKRAISHVWPFSAGSLCSTAADLTAWTSALHGGRVLSADSYRAMTTPASLSDGTRLRYGLGVAIADLRGRRAIFHGGAINGFLSEVEYYPDSGLSVVVLLNTAGPVGPADLAHDIADVVLGKVRESSTAYPGDLSPFVGTFEGVGRGGPTTVTIAIDHRTLTMNTAGSLRTQVLTYRSGETFGAKETLITFEREAGHVARLHVDNVFGHYVLRRKRASTD